MFEALQSITSAIQGLEAFGSRVIEQEALQELQRIAEDAITLRSHVMDVTGLPCSWGLQPYERPNVGGRGGGSWPRRLGRAATLFPQRHGIPRVKEAALGRLDEHMLVLEQGAVRDDDSLFEKDSEIAAKVDPVESHDTEAQARTRNTLGCSSKDSQNGNADDFTSVFGLTDSSLRHSSAASPSELTKRLKALLNVFRSERVAPSETYGKAPAR